MILCWGKISPMTHFVNFFFFTVLQFFAFFSMATNSPSGFVCFSAVFLFWACWLLRTFDAGVFQTIFELTLPACFAFVQILFSEFLAHWAETDLFCQVSVPFGFLSTRTNCQSCCHKKKKKTTTQKQPPLPHTHAQVCLTGACSLNWSAYRQKGMYHLWTELHMKQQML